MKKIYIYISLFFVLFLSSCARAPVREIPPAAWEAVTPIPQVIPTQDIYHVVGPGETLWRISKMYNVEIETIMEANSLTKSDRLEMGQKLLVPGAEPIRPIIPLYESSKWKYIIIHHSATDMGNALQFFKAHLKRGFWRGLGYHFVIDNGTIGKEDGQIEVSPRWIHQENGAHCKAGGMNNNGIGVCLVGNFSRERVTEKQIESVVYLVNILRKQYNIPTRNILGHGQVDGAQTECPGTRFPWTEFYQRLNAGQ